MTSKQTAQVVTARFRLDDLAKLDELARASTATRSEVLRALVRKVSSLTRSEIDVARINTPGINGFEYTKPPA